MKRFLFVFLQGTWGVLQSLLGVVIFLKERRCPHMIYRCCIDTHWDKHSGMSLGLFIFTPREDSTDSSEIRVHEYGHCIQSLVLGPFYLIFGIISIFWANLPYFKRLRREKHIPYTACFVESWASRWGERITGEKAI